MYISLYDLGLFILFAILVIAGVYLIAVLHRVLCIVGHIRTIFETHGKDIDGLLCVLPKTLANVGELAASLKTIVDETSSSLAPLKDNFMDTVDDVRDGLELFAVYAKVIGELFRKLFSRS